MLNEFDFLPARECFWLCLALGFRCHIARMQELRLKGRISHLSQYGLSHISINATIQLVNVSPAKVAVKCNSLCTFFFALPHPSLSSPAYFPGPRNLFFQREFSLQKHKNRWRFGRGNSFKP